MIVVSLEVENIFLQFNFCVFTFLHLRVFLCLIFKLIAFVVAARRLIMLFPWTEAHPAKVCTANFALHMVTTLILFNRPLAFRIGTHLGICDDPRQVLTLARILQLPLLIHFAVCGPMLFLATFEAKTISALAIYNMLRVVFRDPLRCVVTLLRVGTPLDILVIICKRLAVPSEVPIQNL